MTQIVVGVDASERANDAVALAATLARISGAQLLISHVFPLDTVASPVGLPDFERRARERAERLLAGHVEIVGVKAVAVPMPGGSPARRLQELAEEVGAVAIVIGSSHRGALGRVFAGTTAERLLHGAPCPVFVAPRGYRGGELRTILVGHDGGEESQAALEVALATGASVRLVRVIAPTITGSQAAIAGAWVPSVEIERESRDRFAREFAGLQGVERELLLGDPVTELAARSEHADLLLLGSRGHGPHSSVLLGSVSGALVRRAACPVMLVPRGSGAGAAELLSGDVTTRQPA